MHPDGIRYTQNQCEIIALMIWNFGIFEKVDEFYCISVFNHKTALFSARRHPHLFIFPIKCHILIMQTTTNSYTCKRIVLFVRNIKPRRTFNNNKFTGVFDRIIILFSYVFFVVCIIFIVSITISIALFSSLDGFFPFRISRNCKHVFDVFVHLLYLLYSICFFCRFGVLL